MFEKYLTKKDAAEIIGVHERTITRYLNAGKLKGALVGKSWRISESDIREFYDTLKAETAKIISEQGNSGRRPKNKKDT